MIWAYFKAWANMPHAHCAAFMARKKEANALIDALAFRFHCRKGRYIATGSRLDGLWCDGVFPTGWKPCKTRGYGVPNKKTKAGRFIAEELAKVIIPQTEELAAQLGCPPFFFDMDDHGHYCGNIGIFEHKGEFYLQTNRWCRPKTDVAGIREILGSEWHKADEDRAAALKAQA